jgi:hypothetical protein
MTVSYRSPDNPAANEDGVRWSKLPYARTDFFEPLSERFYTDPVGSLPGVTAQGELQTLQGRGLWV